LKEEEEEEGGRKKIRIGRTGNNALAGRVY